MTGLDTDLATLRGTVSAYQDVISLPDVDRHMDAADRVETEIARLRQERVVANPRTIERLQAAERELARVQEGRDADRRILEGFRDKAERELADYKDDLLAVMAEECDGSDDRKHCTCVPPLRRELARLQEGLRGIERMTGAAGTGEVPALVIANYARALLAEDGAA